MNLNQPYYIESREGSCHIDLNGSWDFCYFDTEQTDFPENMWAYTTTLPKSLYHSLNLEQGKTGVAGFFCSP